jgi:hypothetical protein
VSARSRWIGLVLALGLLVAGLRWLWPAQAGDAAPRADAPPPAEAAPPPPLPDADDPALPEAVRRYLEANVYPPSSGRLTPHDEGLLHPNRRYEGLRPIRASFEGGVAAGVSYRLTAERYDLTGGEPPLVWLEAERADGPIALLGVEADVVREGRAGAEGEPLAVEFRETRERWETTLPIDDPQLAEHHGHLVLRARFEYEPGRFHEDTLRFFHTPEGLVPARFDGRFLDYVRDGNLRVEVGVDVLHPGFYRFDANFYDATGAPVAFASFKGELAQGPTSVPLEVFGKVLRDAAAPGPYRIGELRGYRFLDGGFPDHETIPGPGPSWVVNAYDLGEFEDTPWDSEHKRRVVELMLEDEARGIALDVPELAGAPPATPVTPAPAPPATPAAPAPAPPATPARAAP